MSEQPESDVFDDDDEIAGDSEDTNIDGLMRDMESQKRRNNAPRGQEPAWRRLEKLREAKQTKALTLDFEDYELDDE